MPDVDMDKVLARVCDCVEARRGAFWWDEEQRVAIAFGNDGYSENEVAQEVVVGVCSLLFDVGGRVLAFRTSDDGYCWALACQLKPPVGPDHLDIVVWLAAEDLLRLKWRGRPVEFDGAEVRKAAGILMPPNGPTFDGSKVNMAGAV
jgi:hypothetical protein